MTAIHRMVFAILAPAAVYAQAAMPRPEFEVASIKPAPPYDVMSGARMNIGVHIDGAQVHLSYLSLKDYIRMAYNVKLQEIVAPDWVATERYDIDAKLPAGASRDDVPAMLQTLLESRFQLKYHHESREFQVYGLVAAKGGPKLKEVQPDPASDGGDPAKAATNVTADGGPQGTTVRYGPGSYFTMADNKVKRKSSI